MAKKHKNASVEGEEISQLDDSNDITSEVEGSNSEATATEESITHTPGESLSKDRLEIMITEEGRKFTDVHGAVVKAGNVGEFESEYANMLIKLKLAEAV